jgi:hypothetical protein
MTDQWVLDQFGQGSPEQVMWLLGQAATRARTARRAAAHAELAAVYDSDQSKAAKLAAKARIIDKLVDDLQTSRRPNNASLIEVQVYQAGAAAHARAHRACGDLRRLIEAARTLRRKDFLKDLQEDLDPIALVIAARCKPTAPAAAPR